jgi:DNA polymerase-3 subunit gamma/tau
MAYFPDELYNNSYMTQALYRKYRSKKLEDLLEQETTVRILKNAAKAGRIGQAYIFYGPRGTGKTSTARLLAKLLNCEKRRDDPEFTKLGEPCNECAACLAVDAQNSFDVIEIDAASNRGIDEIRNLKESIRTAPAAGGSKVYIIDEAHMLTGAAWNALLKTLEEPPKHAVIVLATTEYEKLPATITSRAQRFAFKKVSKNAIARKLAAEAKAEKIKIDEPALELIAAIAEGSVRDAESLLDQISSIDGAITLADVERITGRSGLAKVASFAAIVVRGDLPAALATLASFSDDGGNPVQFIKDVIHYLRKTLSLKLNPALESVFARDLTTEEIATMKELSAKADPAFLVELEKAFLRAYAEMRYSPFATVPFEIALTEILSLRETAKKRTRDTGSL